MTDSPATPNPNENPGGTDDKVRLAEFMFSKSADRTDLLKKIAIAAAGVVGLGFAVWYFFFRKSQEPATPPTTQDVTNASSGVATSGACAYLETMARTFDAQGIPLQGGFTRVELQTIVACGGPHAAAAKAWLDANPPPTGGGGGGGARTQ